MTEALFEVEGDGFLPTELSQGPWDPDALHGGAPAALMARAEQIAARRKEFADVLQRMAALGQMAKEVQDALTAGADGIDDLQSRMQKIADEAAEIALTARQKDMEDLARQADGLRQQILAAKNKIALLAGKARA